MHIRREWFAVVRVTRVCVSEVCAYQAVKDAKVYARRRA